MHEHLLHKEKKLNSHCLSPCKTLLKLTVIMLTLFAHCPPSHRQPGGGGHDPRGMAGGLDGYEDRAPPLSYDPAGARCPGLDPHRSRL